MNRKEKFLNEEEEEFLNKYNVHEYQHPSVTVDLVIFSIFEGNMLTYLLKREDMPFKGMWSLPGGFVGMEESLEQTVARVLKNKVGVDHVFFEQLYTFGDVKRDPRTRVISISYMALVPYEKFLRIDDQKVLLAKVCSSCVDDGYCVKNQNDEELELAFDHFNIICLAVKRLKSKLNYTPVGYELLPEEFTLFQLQKIHEAILGEKINKDSFRRKVLASNQIEDTLHMQNSVGHRPAHLYRFIK